MAMKALSCAFTALALTMGAAVSNAAADVKAEYDKRAAERYAALFRGLDLDRDGMLSKAEVRGDVNFSPFFDDMDINRDGIVTAPELQRFVEQRHGVRIEFGR